MHRRRHRFPTALSKVVQRVSQGNQSEFAEKIGLTPAAISRLCAGTREISRETLEKLSQQLSKDDCDLLFRAATLDFLPPMEEKEAQNYTHSGALVREEAAEFRFKDREVEDFLQWLGKRAIEDGELRTWLKTLNRWMRPDKDTQSIPPM